MTRPLSVYTVARIADDRESAPGADWRRKAACLDEDPELFFPVGISPQAREQADEAKAVCRRCPVLTTCDEWALAFRPMLTDGIFGGRDGNERIAKWRAAYRVAGRARREAGPINHGTEAGVKAHSRRGEKACQECLDGAARTRRWRKAEQRARKAATS